MNVPVGIGGFVGSKLAGCFCGQYGDKAVLALILFARMARKWSDMNA